MPPAARPGVVYRAGGRDIGFSLHPLAPVPGAAHHRQVFANDPWAVMNATVASSRSLRQERKAEARGFLEQAEDFFSAATGRLAARPLLNYYAFLNLAKAVLAVREPTMPLDRAQHGLSDQRIAPADPWSLDNAKVVVQSHGTAKNVFRELLATTGAISPPLATDFKVVDLLGSLVVGHRIWRDATGEPEAFFAVEHFEIMHDSTSNEMWVRIFIDADDLRRHGVRLQDLRRRSRLATDFHVVDGMTTGFADPRYACLEQTTPHNYGYAIRSRDGLRMIADALRPNLWCVITSMPTDNGFRRYYLHGMDTAARPHVTQLATMWLVLFYLGSVVRYRPHTFDDMVSSKYGGIVTEFISSTPNQMLYLLASELCRREIVRPAIV